MSKILRPFMATRRKFLKQGAQGLGLLSLSQYAPSFLTQSALAGESMAERDRQILVIIQLAGGNDGLNTVIPFTDDRYYNLRPELAIRGKDALQIDDHYALHSACSDFRSLYQEGEMAIVQNVGYPNPNRSHFRSMDIWEYGSDVGHGTGWIGRYLDNECAGGVALSDPQALHLGKQVPNTFTSKKRHRVFSKLTADGRSATSVDRGKLKDEQTAALLKEVSMEAEMASIPKVSFLQHSYMDALVTEERIEDLIFKYLPDAEYPQQRLARELKNVSALIAGGLSTRVYYVSLGGFDTHDNQPNRHQQLLKELSGAVGAFYRDLKAKKLDEQVVTMTFSEFGRRPYENGSIGTDHGTIAPMFLFGPSVAGGFHGTAPDLDVPEKKDIPFDEKSTDFRSVYASVLDNWMQCDSRRILQGDYSKLGILKS